MGVLKVVPGIQKFLTCATKTVWMLREGREGT